MFEQWFSWIFVVPIVLVIIIWLGHVPNHCDKCYNDSGAVDIS